VVLFCTGLAAGVWPATATDATPIVLDDFGAVDAWSAHPATGVRLDLSADGGAMRLDFDFQKGGGYAVARRALPLELPANYRFRFRVRGDAPPNDLEFKLIAPGMENVWWRNARNFTFPRDWDAVMIRKRHITFAWGPSGGGEMRHVAALEIAITAGSGGKGTVWIDDLVLEPLPEPGTPAAPVASATSSIDASAAALALDGDSTTAWRPNHLDRVPRWTMDLGAERAFGGLVLTWAAGRHAADYDVELSDDGARWRIAREVRRSDGGMDPILMTDTDARFVRITVRRAASRAGVLLAEAELQPLEWGASRETFFRALAAAAPRGHYPRAYLGEQSYWTVVGLDADRDEAMIDEDGRIEAGKAQFSVEPFVHLGERLITWADAEHEQGLEEGSLPLPWVLRRAEGLDLRIQAFPVGAPGRARVIARYTLANTGAAPARGTLYLALRPFQVNPPQQNLNTLGGTARMRRISLSGLRMPGAPDGRAVAIDGALRCVSVTAPDAFGAATFDEGGIMPALAAGRLPAAAGADDPFEHASGAYAYAFDLPPGGSRTVDLRLALEPDSGFAAGEGLELLEREVRAAVADWHWRTRGARIALPDSQIAHTLNAQIGWIFVNRDGAAIQPGSRAYERSWIRDGALTSAALLRTGHASAVREFIEWFAPYLYDDGKVPCCVDHRGSDPVPEHDSSGEWIHLVAEYVRHTGNRELAERMWPTVERAVGYLDSLRQTRRTAEYRSDSLRHFFGLLPPSISHEGYSAKPMHSYWDDFFTLRGFADAVYLADALGRRSAALRTRKIHDEFERELLASIRATMRVHGIDYIPGAADLGDFDATSTTIALSPGEALDVLPRAAVERTFERYWTFFTERRDGVTPWEAMTPYELRTIGAFVRLGWRERANELLDWFMTLRRPAGWAHWAEVVDREPRRVRFLGDMPHTWVGSDYVRSVLDMLAYERERDAAIVIGAGVPWAWVSEGEGARVTDLSTSHGLLSFAMRARGDALEVRIEAGATPEGGFVITPPFARPFRSARVDGRRVPLGRDGSVKVRRSPVVVVFEP
jgi:hypothetical protein